MIFTYPSYLVPVNYSFEIIEDPSLLVDFIQSPELREIDFIIGYSSMVWQECIFDILTSSGTEAFFCGSFTYAFTSESSIYQYVS